MDSISISWHIDDVYSLGYDLSDDERMEVLNFCKEHHNAEIGINWDVLESTIWLLYPNKERIENV